MPIQKNILHQTRIVFTALDFEELTAELIRKSIHFLIALSPLMAAVNRSFTVALLITGIITYACLEKLRLGGRSVPLISFLTAAASRRRDRNRFVLGPVTLGLGALLALLFYPSPAASIAVYALAFGDGFASLVGKFFGRIRPPLLLGKSLEGSLACFTAVFIAAHGVSGRITVAAFAGFIAALTEALPLEDYDNIVLPLTVGFMVQLVF
ncbi:MAG: phosphatidate cytidylyltransferase [Treponema sp.]|jgi:dolichol kinase|nr:phosphatidate cytidylyltransferase [Treponema sp.]